VVAIQSWENPTNLTNGATRLTDANMQILLARLRDNATCPDYQCACQDVCDGWSCGNRFGCECGGCPSTETCNNGLCQSVPQCGGRTCGDDGAGGVCGVCSTGTSCDGFDCVPNVPTTCVPDCQWRTDGPDGCGGQCEEPEPAPAGCYGSDCGGFTDDGHGSGGSGGGCSIQPTAQGVDYVAVLAALLSLMFLRRR